MKKEGEGEAPSVQQAYTRSRSPPAKTCFDETPSALARQSSYQSDRVALITFPQYITFL